MRVKNCEYCGAEFQYASGKSNRKFCSKSCSISAMNKAAGKNMTGFMTDEGFVGMGVKGYPTIRVDGVRMPMHRYVMEKHLGRKLEPYEHVHHRDGDRANYDVDNLQIWDTNHQQQPAGIRRIDHVIALFDGATDADREEILSILKNRDTNLTGEVHDCPKCCN